MGLVPRAADGGFGSASLGAGRLEDLLKTPMDHAIVIDDERDFALEHAEAGVILAAID